MKAIDPHVHLRGTEYSQDFFNLGFQQATTLGLGGLGEMPNCEPWLVTLPIVRARLDRSDQYTTSHVVHVGLTTSIEQVRDVLTWSQSVKMFLTHSTGNMGLLDEDYQKAVWKELVAYEGVVMMHCEDEKEWRVPFNDRMPTTHSYRQNPESEYIQVERQLRNASDAGFQGIFYVCHVSSPMTLDLFRRPKYEFDIVAEVTWHHMFLNTDDYRYSGNRLKMNPPLRSKRLQEMLLERVMEGACNIIGSDHAPHPVEHKITAPFKSGIPALPFWPRGVEMLQKLGINDTILKNMCYGSAMRVFGFREPLTELGKYDVKMWGPYGYNPFINL